jgi:hypothetical protein
MSFTSKKRSSYHEKVQGLIRQGRGLGFFGDDVDKIRENNEKKENESKLKVNQI